MKVNAAILHLLLWLFLISFQTLATAKSCPPKPVVPDQEMATQAMQNAQNHGFLWRISKDGIDSYLFGTIHLAKFNNMFLGPKIISALNQSDTVALEIDMLDPNMVKRITQSFAQAKSHPIPQKLKNQIKAAAEEVCLAYPQLKGLIPELQLITITTSEAAYDGVFSQYAIDGFIAGFAHQTGKKVISLETPENQVNILSMDSQAETIKFVEKSLSQIKSGKSKAIIQRMYQTWLASDSAAFKDYEQWCDCMETELDKKYMKRLLDDRNIGMADKIDQLHKQKQKVFAAVGTLHLFGEKALPALLQQKGYKVQQINF